MRQLVLFIAIITLTVPSRAQITLTAATSNPWPGDTATFYVVTNVSTGDSGAAVIWDYSMLQPANKKTLYYHLQGGGCDSYPTPLVSTGTGECDYYQVDNDFFSMAYRSTSDTFYKYHDNKLILRYPLTYNAQVYIDTFSRSDSIGGWFMSYPYASQGGYQYISSDAYGTLILPDSTYTDVLRVKKVVSLCTNVVGISNLIYTDMEVYEWYSADCRTFLLQVNNFIYNSVTVAELTVPEVSIYPNPSYGTLNVELSNASPEHIYLMDITGKKLQMVTAVKGAKKYTMDVSGFVAGIYFLEVGTDNGKLVRKIQIGR